MSDTLELTENALTEVVQLGATGAGIGTVGLITEDIGVDPDDYAALLFLPEDTFRYYQRALNVTLAKIAEWADETLTVLDHIYAERDQ